MKAGIVSYGASFPYYRVNPKDIHKTWVRNALEAELDRTGLKGRGVVGPDEDTITFAADAARKALDSAGIAPEKIGALFVGTQTNPYVMKPIASVLGDMLLLGPELISGDCQYSGKSGTLALQAVWGLVAAGIVEYGLVVAADTLSLHVAPGNPLEYTAAAGGAALLVGREGIIAEIEGTASFTSDMTDYFRLDEDRYMSWGGAAMTASKVGMPAHLSGSVRSLFEKLDLSAQDFSFASLPQPDHGTALKMGKSLGFEKKQIEQTLFAQNIGDCGSAAPLVGLMKALEGAEKGQRILMASYGYGAGSDAFAMVMSGEIPESAKVMKIDHLFERYAFVDYPASLKFERKLHTASTKSSPYV